MKAKEKKVFVHLICKDRDAEAKFTSKDYPHKTVTTARYEDKKFDQGGRG